MGRFTYDELQHVFDELPAMPGFRKGLRAIADFRECHMALTGADIQELAYYAKRSEAAWGETKWAIIAPDWLGLGVEMSELLKLVEN